MALLKANTGIGTTNPTSALHVIGDGLVTGVVTATTFNGNINSEVSTLGIASATNLTSQQLSVSGISTLGVTTVTNLTAESINSSGIVTGSSFRPSSGYYQSANGTNSFYVYDGTGNVAFQGTIGASQVNNASGNKVIGFAGTNITFENDARVGNDFYVAGVSTFIGGITGTISTATKLENARTFEITGDIVASPIAFDGTGNVSLAATIQPNSVGLGTDTFGDYVKDISGTANQIDVTGGTGEGSTPVISFAPNPTIGGNVTIGNDLQVNNNLNVTGNITVGGTAGFILVENFRVTDADIVLGFTTDSNGNDVSTDTTANHGGIAIASTEGNPLVTLTVAGIETLPPTYKKIMWFKAGSFAGLNTDAWLSNYAIGIGSTQFPSGTRLAAGSVQFTENDVSVVRNINASGIITGTLDNTLTLTTSGNGITGSASYNNSGPATFTVVSDATDTNTPETIVYRDASGNFSAGTITANLAGTATTSTNLSDAANITTGTIDSARLTGTYDINISGNAATSNYADNSGVSTNVIGGIASVTQLTVSGISTLGIVTASNIYSTGIVTALTFVGNLTGTASTASFATTALTLNGVIEENLSVGLAASLKGGDAGNVPYQSATNTTTFVPNGTSGQVLLFNGSVPIWENITAAAGAFGGITVKDEGNTVGTSGSIVSLDFVGSNLAVTATSGSNGIATITMSDNLVGTALSISGISTFSNNVSVGSGITLYASTGIVSATAFYGSGVNLTDLLLGKIEGIQVQNEGSNVGSGISFATLNFVGDYVTATGVGTTANITFSAPQFSSTAGVSTSVIGGIASITSLNVSGISTLEVTSVTNLTAQQLNVSGVSTFGGNVQLGDNDQLIIGDGGDLKLVHTGSNSFIQDVGTGSLFIDASSTFYRSNTQTFQNGGGTETLATFTENGSVALYYDNSKKFETSGAGATVYGTLDTTQLNVSGVSTFAGITTVTGTTLFTRQLSVSGVSTVGNFRITPVGTGATVGGIGVTYYGDGSQLSGIQGGSAISTETSNQSQYIPYATSFGSTTGLGATTLLVYNPSTTRLGIGTTNPQENLHVVGNVLVNGIVTATSFSGNATSATYATSAGIATYATSAGIATYATSAGIATYATIAGIATNATTAGTATTATNINISATSTGDTTTHIVLVGDNTTGGQQPFIDNGSLTYNGSTNVLTAGGFSGDGSTLTSLNGSQITSGTIPGDRGVTSGSTSSSFVEYNGTTATSGQFDGGTTTPSGTTRLNYGGYLYATRFYGNGSNITALDASNISSGTLAVSRGGTNSTATPTNGGVSYGTGSAFAFTSAGTLGQILQSAGAAAPTWSSNLNLSGIITASSFVGNLTGTATTSTNATVTTSTSNSAFKVPFANTTANTTGNYGLLQDSEATFTYNPSTNTLTAGTFSGTASFATSAGVSTNVIGGIGNLTQLQVTGISTFTNGPVLVGSATSTGTALQRLQVTGGAYVSGNVGIATTNPLQPLQVGSGTTIVIIDALGDVGIGTTNATSKLHVVGGALVTGVSTIGNFRIAPVGTGATVGGIGVTYYGDGSQLSGVVSPASNGEFYTGVSSSLQLTPLSYETSIYTFPSTAGKQYVIESINVANVDTSVGVGTTVNIIASIQNSTGEQTYIAYNVPIVNGGLIELLKNPIVAGPSDVIKMWVTNDAYTGVNNAAEVYMNYSEYTSTEYISEYASTVSIATTDPTAVYTSSTYPSTIESIHFANRTDTGDYPVSVSITNGLTTTYLAKNLIIPRYSTVDILDRPKRVETNGVIKVEVAQTSTIDVIIAGKQITS